MSRDDFRRRADVVRAIPLEVVLTSWGAVRDRRDQSRWHTRRGPLSVTGTQFFNWHAAQGGGGAIDLVMHLGDWDAGQAIEWLGRQLGCQGPGANRRADRNGDPAACTTGLTLNCESSSSRGTPWMDEDQPDAAGPYRHPQLRLPAASLAHLPHVTGYLTEQRGLAADLLVPLIDEGKLYADARGNVVFLMVAGKPNRAIGAELRGTGNRLWRGLAPGTRRNAGYFWIGKRGSKRIVLCESAIDAISCFQLHMQSQGTHLRGECICISTAGVRPDIPWLRPLLACGYDIHCGFDADEPGEAASRRLIARHPTIQRLRPSRHDWNDALTAGQ